MSNALATARVYNSNVDNMKFQRKNVAHDLLLLPGFLIIILGHNNKSLNDFRRIRFESMLDAEALTDCQPVAGHPLHDDTGHE